MASIGLTAARAIRGVVVFGLLAQSVACLGVETLEVAPSSVVLTSLDETERLKPVPKDGKGQLVRAALRELKWTSSDEKVATVNPAGQVTPTGFGEATITVSVGGKSAECKVRVAIPKKIVVEPNPLEIKGLNVPIELAAKIYDEQGVQIETSAIAWSSENEEIVVVSSGKAQGVGLGSTKIKASMGPVAAEIPVKVTYPDVAKLVIEPTEFELGVGEAIALPIVGYDDQDKPLLLIPVTFSSSKPKIASVNEDGVVSGLRAGKAEVMAKASGQVAVAHVVVH